MTNLLKKLIVPLLGLFFIVVPLTVPAIVSADIQSSLCGSAQDLSVNPTSTCKDTSGSESRFQIILTDIINIFSIIVGIVAVVMIIFGGFKYITSAGNQENIKSARNTIIYALVGLIIVALAQVIVRFVLREAVNGTTTTTTGQSSQGGGKLQ